MTERAYEPEPGAEIEAYQPPDITPDFCADANEMYPGYQQAETDPGAEWLAQQQAEAEAEAGQ